MKWIGLGCLLVGMIAGCEAVVAPQPAPIAVPAAVRAAPVAPTPVARPTVERVIELGQTVEGRPLRLYLIGSGAQPTLVLGGIHGNEQNSAEVAAELLALLRQQPGLLVQGAVAILPCANPDGNAKGLRANARRVDLNRNFPAANWAKSKWKGPYFGGEAAASEPETRAIVAAIEQVRPARILTIHSMPQPCNNYDGPGEPIARAMAARNGYPVKASIGYPTPGSLGSFAGIDRQIPTITLELPTKMSGSTAWANNRDAILVMIHGEPLAAASR